jgi:ATP-binding cassette subfamily F protein 3
VDRFRYKKSKAKQAQAKLTQIGRLEQERSVAATKHESLTRKRRMLGFEFLQPPRTGRVVLEAEHISLTAGDKPLLEDAMLVLERGEKVALVGPNGSGKTTLVEAILGRRELDGGIARLGHGVVPGYFSQHTHELPAHGTVLDCAAAETGLPRPQAQALLGRFLFSGWDTHTRPVTALSGGEHRRLALALLVASGANFLLLDEPTNHLDVESREALETALEAFPGTVLVVSHDRALLDAVPDRIVVIRDRTLRSYPGGWADLQQAVSAESAPAETENVQAPPKAAPRPRPERTQPSELELLEERIAQAEAEVARRERELVEDWADEDAQAAHRAARDELTALLERWEVLFTEAEAR